MKTRSVRFLAFCVLVLTAGLAHAGEPEPSADRPLVPMMRRNFETVLELQEIAASPESLKSRYGEIVTLVDRLAGIAHVLPEMTSADRPGLAAVAGVYSEYLSDLKAGLKHGDPVYLRNRIRTAAGFCFECHTSQPGKGFEDPAKRVESLKLRPFQKAEFLAATRQFDDALRLYQGLIAREPSDAARSTELAHAVRNALTLAVRVKQDPKLAEKILNAVSEREDLTAYFRGQIGAWRKDVADWKKEKPLSGDAPAVSFLEKADRLVARAQKLQAYPADHSGDVSYLRAVASAHEALTRKADAAQRADAFLLLGKAQAVLEDPLLWNLDEYYWEACVRSAPHTPTARACFDRWMQETTFDYTGSAGTDIPANAEEKIRTLRDLSR